jgi:sugar phosphate isomerase/epimerase
MPERKIALQLYSVREYTAEDFPGTLKKVAEMGYPAVQFAGFQGCEPAELKKVLDDLGLETCSIHGPWPAEENRDEIVELAQLFGYDLHVAGLGRGDCESAETLAKAVERVRSAVQALGGTGIGFALHNHWWEFDRHFDGRRPHDIVMSEVPHVGAEIDTYWTAVGGADPVTVLRNLGPRVRQVHIKDGPLVQPEAMTAIGAGKMQWPPIMDALDPATDYLIVELDRCDTDMLQAVKDSHDYLVGEGYAVGRS